jgi:hypothetical protein
MTIAHQAADAGQLPLRGNRKMPFEVAARRVFW